MASVASLPCAKAVVAATPPGTACDKKAEPGILAATILASSMAFIDGTVVNVALPAVQQSLGATLADGQWVIEAYELMLAALLLVGGAAGDRFGRRRVFVIGVVVFTAASIACGLSNSVGMLIVARGLQGIGGALLVPGSLALISASFDKERRGRAIGTWSGFTAITTAFGPVLGGFLIDYGSWRYAFFLNVPLSLAVLVLTFRYVPESRGELAARAARLAGCRIRHPRFGRHCLCADRSANRRLGQSRGMGLAGDRRSRAACIHLRRIAPTAPMLPLHLFRSRDFAGANLLTLLLYAALAGSLFFLPLNLIQVQGYSTAAAGAALLPFVLLMFVLVALGGRAGRALRREAAAGRRAHDCCVRICAVRAARDRRQLLDYLFPRGAGAGLRNDVDRCPADDDGHASVVAECGRHRLRDQ